MTRVSSRDGQKCGRQEAEIAHFTCRGPHNVLRALGPGAAADASVHVPGRPVGRTGVPHFDGVIVVEHAIVLRGGGLIVLQAGAQACICT